jgi:hypothetical protein
MTVLGPYVIRFDFLRRESILDKSASVSLSSTAFGDVFTASLAPVTGSVPLHETHKLPSKGFDFFGFLP